MDIRTLFITSWNALRRNAARTMLTMMGIVIGIAAVITMMEIGKGSARAIQKNIERYGANVIVISGGVRRVAGVSMGTSTRISLTSADAEAIRRNCPLVQHASSVVGAGNIQLVTGENNWVPANILGIDAEYFKIRDWDVADGRLFTREEVEQHARVCLIGQTVLRELYHGRSPVGTELRIGMATMTVIGVMEGKGATMRGDDEDDVVVAPWTTVRMRITGMKTGAVSNSSSTPATSPGATYSNSGIALYPPEDPIMKNDRLWQPRQVYISQIVASATDSKKISETKMEISMLLRERHGLSEEMDDDFRIWSNADLLTMMNNTSELMNILLLVLAVISLIVGGVGIMNVMLASVIERTREIGLRMAVGARSRDILKQFLFESVLICVVGGGVGIILGHGVALIVESLLQWPIAASVSAVVASVAISSVIGIVFGFYPAWKASRLDPIEALQHE